ncbi:MAG: formylglycine-generating enzyme family protein [Verrucomicrobiales bacterium]|nr:formylglycine-generating enzyme family protein [Verrucomicrobiales bacterium]
MAGTQAEYQAVGGVNPSWYKGDLDLPVENVLWEDAAAYCEELTQRERTAGRLSEGWEYRLPTEAQWEYACRAGTTTRFNFGDALGCNNNSNCSFCAEMDQCLVWCANSGGQTQRVGSRLPNPWGFYDMHGNVGEWCSDRYADSYPGSTVTDPAGPASGAHRVFRGGALNFEAQYCRSAARYAVAPSSFKGGNVGFRVALVEVR